MTVYKKAATFFAITFTALAFSGCSKNVRDIKMSEITVEQKQEAKKAFNQEEQKLVSFYEMIGVVDSSKVKGDDLTYNEIFEKSKKMLSEK